LIPKFNYFIYGKRLTIEIVDVSPIVGNEFGTCLLGCVFKSSSDGIVSERIFKLIEAILRIVCPFILNLAHRLVPFVAWIVEHLIGRVTRFFKTKIPRSELKIMLFIPTIRFPVTRTIFPGVRSIV